MMMSMDRQRELNLLISQSEKKVTWGICDWISFKSTSRSIELALLISKEGGEGEARRVTEKFGVDTVGIIHLPFPHESEEGGMQQWECYDEFGCVALLTV